MSEYVECVDNTDAEYELTLGAIYKVLSCQPPHYQLTNDVGKVEEYGKRRFVDYPFRTPAKPDVALEEFMKEDEQVKLKRFFFGTKPNYDCVSQSLRDQGKCPRCGQTARIHLSTFVCDIHGAFE